MIAVLKLIPEIDFSASVFLSMLFIKFSNY